MGEVSCVLNRKDTDHVFRQYLTDADGACITIQILNNQSEALSSSFHPTTSHFLSVFHSDSPWTRLGFDNTTNDGLWREPHLHWLNLFHLSLCPASANLSKSLIQTACATPPRRAPHFANLEDAKSNLTVKVIQMDLARKSPMWLSSLKQCERQLAQLFVQRAANTLGIRE